MNSRKWNSFLKCQLFNAIMATGSKIADLMFTEKISQNHKYSKDFRVEKIYCQVTAV